MKTEDKKKMIEVAKEMLAAARRARRIYTDEEIAEMEHDEWEEWYTHDRED